MKYFSTFSGIGGFEHGIERAFDCIRDKSERSKQGKKREYSQRNELHAKVINRPSCVGYSEIDKYASAIYNYHYPNHKNYGDITSINVRELPDFDLFVGGFPCQAFSIAGKRQGFSDTRGTLFFDVARILKAKRPEWFLLENVKGLLNHDSGKTIGTIFGVLTELGYSVGWEVVNSCHFGVPQNRERIFIVGHLREAGGRSAEVFPFGGNNQTSNKSAQNFESGDFRYDEGFRFRTNGLVPRLKAKAGGGESQNVFVRAVLTPDRLEKRQNGRRFKDNDEPSFTLTSQDKHGVQIGTSIRRLTPIECERLQGFPDSWTAKGIIDGKEVEISDTQRYKTLGNAVTVNVIEAIINKLNVI